MILFDVNSYEGDFTVMTKITDQEAAIPQPVATDPQALVENTFALPGTDNLADPKSNDEMSDYLVKRLQPEVDKTHIILTQTGMTMPGLQRVVSGEATVLKSRKTTPREWVRGFSLNDFLGVTLGSLALVNIAANLDTVDGAARYGVHSIYRAIDPVRDTTTTEHQISRTPGAVQDIAVSADSANRVGSTSISPTDINSFISSVRDAEAHGAALRSITIIGNTSDEWGSDASIATNDANNDALGQARAKAAEEALSAQGFVIDPHAVSLTSKEHVITAADKQALQAEAKADGFRSLSAAITAVDNGQKVNAGLATRIKQLFTGKDVRGATLKATVAFQGQDIVTDKKVQHVIPGVDHAPRVPKPHFVPIFMPWLAIRKREKYLKTKNTYSWEVTKSRPIFVPSVVREDAEHVWLRLRPEAKNTDGTLIDQAWAYTRKIEHLFRDDRIQDVLRADFKDDAGNEKSLRMLFVDHTPEPETVTKFSSLLEKFAAMKAGSLGSDVKAILVYPSENAGIRHGDPKRISVGIDKQRKASTLGTYNYPLGLVELHMPTDIEGEDLENLLETFNGPSWVLSHETAGHGTDQTDTPQTLHPVLVHNIPNAHIVKGDRQANVMLPLEKKRGFWPQRKPTLRALPHVGRALRKPIEFDATYTVVDGNGNQKTIPVRVTEDDPRLTHAATATIISHKPTQYADTNAAEHYAETAASVTTGIPVPYRQAHVRVEQLTMDNGEAGAFATGHRPAREGQDAFTAHVGAKTGAYPVDFEKASEVTTMLIAPEEDKLLREHIVRAKSSPILPPHKMIAILAKVTRGVSK